MESSENALKPDMEEELAVSVRTEKMLWFAKHFYMTQTIWHSLCGWISHELLS